MGRKAFLATGLSIAWMLLVTIEGAAANSEAARERIAADSPRATVLGNTFIAPGGWTLFVQGASTILEAPEGGSFLVLFDVPVKNAATADDAVAAAWFSYNRGPKRPLNVMTPAPDKDGWTDRKSYVYKTSPNEKRDVDADVRRANTIWIKR